MTFDDVVYTLSAIEDLECGGAVDETAIAQAERQLGIAFPAPYRRFVARFGWCAIGPFELFGLGHDVPAHLDVVAVTQRARRATRPRLPQHLLALANDGAGNLFCLDCQAATDDPPVLFWNHERQENQDPEMLDGFLEWLSDSLDAAREA